MFFEVNGGGVQYDYGFRIYDSRIARFMSVDPLTTSYPELTPYQFAGNSPITFLDGDGREIIIYLSNGQSFKYSPFMKVPNDHFAKKVIESLNAISGTEEGSSVINQLINSDKRYHLKQSDILFNPDPTNKQNDGLTTASFGLGESSEIDQEFEKMMSVGDYKKGQELLEKTNDHFIGAYGGNIDKAWNVNGINLDYVKMDFTVMLGHELFHAYQYDIGQSDGSFLGGYMSETSGIMNLEVQSVGFENYLRYKLYAGSKLEETRAHYSHNSIDEYYEKTDWWDYILGFDKLDSKEFIPGGSAYDFWKKSLQEKSKKKSQELLNQEP
ncbi:MAG: RHS repeat-associated protein [Saprospiraceae bacterium]|jgi:RHS repeat-associated protein